MRYTLFILALFGVLSPIFSAPVVQNVTWTSPVYVTVSGNSMTRTTGGGTWDAGAFSTQSITADGYVESTAQETSTYRMFGFSDANTNASYQTIDYAIYLSINAVLAIYENGTHRGNFGTYATGDILRVVRIGTTIHYYKNDAIFYTSSTASSGTLYGDTSLYTSGATIYNAKIATGTVPEPSSILLFGFVCMAIMMRRKLS